MMRHALLSGMTAVCLTLPSFAMAEPITLPHTTQSDLRGVLNVLHLFKAACLDTPLTRDAPAQIAPDGYTVVSFQEHLEIGPAPQTPTSLTLTATGTEDGDWTAGQPYVEFAFPSDRTPNGRCTTYWKRAWDYEDGQDSIALSMAGVMDGYLSYHLRAIRISPPGSGLTLGASYTDTSDWATVCEGGVTCAFSVIYEFNPETGVSLNLSTQ